MYKKYFRYRNKQNTNEISDYRSLYNDYYKEINSRILSNIENYDKAILSLSVGLLGLSITFIKNIVSLNKADDLYLLQLSWLFLVFAIMTTILSFLAGNLANEKHLEFAEDYYLNDNENAFDQKSIWTTITEWLNRFSGIWFILGIILTVTFVNTNIDKKGDKVKVHNNVAKTISLRCECKSSDKKPLTEGTVPPKITPKPSKGQ